MSREIFFLGIALVAARYPFSPEAWTLSGAPLFAPNFTGLVKEGLDAQWDIAKANLLDDACAAASPAPHDSHDPAKEVWLGRRLAYLWFYREALDVYSAAIERAPKYSQLHRHRGHRHLTTRNYSLAESDLRTAAALLPEKDGWEEDGSAGAYNLPLSTKHFNVFYHLGLSRYLQADWAGALAAYADMPAAMNDESVAATTHWTYMALRRKGDAAAANASLSRVHAGMRALDGGAYLNLTLLYKGERSEASVLPEHASELDLATLGYGVGNWHHYNGRHDAAIALWRRVVNTSYWAAFGYLAAEAELHRLGHAEELRARRCGSSSCGALSHAPALAA